MTTKTFDEYVSGDLTDCFEHETWNMSRVYPREKIKEALELLHVYSCELMYKDTRAHRAHSLLTTLLQDLES
jgi:hypothetical protein